MSAPEVALSSRGDPAADAAPGAVIGSCFGFAVRSSVPHRLLREGDHGALLTVEEHAGDVDAGDGDPLIEWEPTPKRELHARVFADGSRFALWTDLDGWFRIDPDRPSIEMPVTSEPIRREERTWGIPALLCYIRRRDLPLHAAAVEVDGNALLFAAPGHFGKTTLAAAFLAAGHRVLAEDIACCRTDPQPAILPGPAVLRVRRDSYERLEIPHTVVAVEEPGRVHLVLEGPARGDGRPVPLRGIVLLRADADATRLERVRPPDALQDLWALSLKLPTDADRERCFSSIAALVDRVPVWNLHRRLEFETLPALIDRIVDACVR